MTWNAVSGETGYQVQRIIRNRAGTPGVWTNITTVTARSFTEDVTGVTVGMVAGQSVKYRVRAMSGATGGAFTETYYLFLNGGIYVGAGQFSELYIGTENGNVRIEGFYVGTESGNKESKTEFQKEMGQ